jgi:predicted molibdopterin-dependent oxidoreductase YjgC
MGARRRRAQDDDHARGAGAAAAALRGAAAEPGRVAILAGGRATNEDYYLLSRLARVALGTHQIDWRLDYYTAEAARAASSALAASNGDLAKLEHKAYAATLFVGSDLRETIPVTGLNLRDAARHGHTRLFTVGSRQDGWLSPFAQAAPTLRPKRSLRCSWKSRSTLAGQRNRKRRRSRRWPRA